MRYRWIACSPVAGPGFELILIAKFGHGQTVREVITLNFEFCD